MSDKARTTPNVPFKKRDKHPPTEPDDSATKAYRKLPQEAQYVKNSKIHIKPISIFPSFLFQFLRDEYVMEAVRLLLR